ncbi:PRC-barrel domain-containing protein [Fulvimarina sp. 2208YS6-2-32]|uniref:PRC-barrel domain-containing protein n=1 Tax=Fulvimarina uroteuthidis TaxID=3098149 RepID=A0ABU5HY08_9HYPH|nr:PRC-barrel domain-containing protein [Fulvimarina sp. 2208YS6-2-32]MDY8107658.1 PRC-barrel domain-containing protein [Fulvimarina sp. 2208YS6-2-32]
MLRKLLVTTALAGVLATGAYAQDAAPTEPAAPEANQDMDSTSGAASTDTQASMDAPASGDYLQSLSDDQYLAANITGQSLYASDAQDAEAVATIDNYLVGSDGQIVAAIVTTSGDAAKTVAVPFDQISWSMNEDNEPRATMASGGSDLASMPAFTLPSEQQAATEGMASDGTAAGDMAATGGSATATDPAAGGASGTAATGGAATDTAASGTAATGTAATDAPATEPAATTDAAETSSTSDTPTMVGPDQYLTENVIGADVTTGAGDNAESFGEINNLVVSSSGEVVAGVIGVGGFLGIGEKDVAVPFDNLTLNRQEDGTPQVVYASDRAQLEEAPSFSGDRESDTAEGEQASGMSAESTAAATGAAAGAAATGAANSMEQAGDEVAQSTDNATDAMTETDASTSAASGAGTVDGVATENGAATSTGDTTMAADAQADMQPVDDTSTLTADDLIGTSVVGPTNDSVGDVGDIVLSPEGGIEAVIIDVGGFLGIGTKPVSVNLDDLQFMRDANGSLAVQTALTSEQLEAAPEFEEDAATGAAATGAAATTEPAAGTAEPAN